MVERNIILTGFMGTGKTAVGSALAKRLGWRFVDTDELIRARESMTIPEIFEKRGEAHFRTVENTIASEFAFEKGLIIATGGGMSIDPRNRESLNAAGLVVNLACGLEEVFRRIGDMHSRPLLECEDRVQRAFDLFKGREPAYGSFPFQVDTTGLGIDDVVTQIQRIAESLNDEVRFLAVNALRNNGYTIALGPGVLDLVGDLAACRGLSSKIAVVTDTHVGPLYLDRVLASLGAAGFKPFPCVVPAGEESKNTSSLEALYGHFLECGLDRRGAVVALGGGVVGDLAGFAAATYMRGVALVQCPTSLLALVDSSVGGKTGVDLPQGKNLVGAFKNPFVVVADTDALATLPPGQVRMGMAELIKHTIIDDADLFKELERAQGPLTLNPDLIARSVSVKIRVVGADPYESGLREVLNLGHTVGHALEKCSQYALDHGAAVSVGLVAAAELSRRIGMCDAEIPNRVETVLAASGLPIRHHMDPDQLMSVMLADKKTVDGQVRFVLIKGIGEVLHGVHVAPEVLRETLASLNE